jgi:hypothetical protein
VGNSSIKDKNNEKLVGFAFFPKTRIMVYLGNINK